MGYKSWLYIKYEQGLNLPYYHKFMQSQHNIEHCCHSVLLTFSTKKGNNLNL